MNDWPNLSGVPEDERGLHLLNQQRFLIRHPSLLWSYRHRVGFDSVYVFFGALLDALVPCWGFAMVVPFVSGYPFTGWDLAIIMAILVVTLFMRAGYLMGKHLLHRARLKEIYHRAQHRALFFEHACSWYHQRLNVDLAAKMPAATSSSTRRRL